jgi:hypothetical protein
MSQQQNFSAYATLIEILRSTPGSKQDTFNVYVNLNIQSGFKNDNASNKIVIDYRVITAIFSGVTRNQINLLTIGSEVSIFGARILSINILTQIDESMKDIFGSSAKIDDIIASISHKSGIDYEIIEKLIPAYRKTSLIEIPNNCWQLRATGQQAKNINKIEVS